jgi:excisionase family DNA binding protein
VYDDILTVEEAAELLKVAPDIVLDLLMSSELPGRNIGGEWRTTKRALVSFVDGVPLQAECCLSDGCCAPCPAGSTVGCRSASGRRCA